MTTVIIRLINEIKIYVLLKIEMLFAIQTNLKFYQIHFHFKDKKKNSASTSKNNEEEISKGRFFSISVCRFLQISGPTNSLRATGLNAGLTNF